MDERGRRADWRELRANEREQAADEREQRTPGAGPDELSPELGSFAAGRASKALESVERSLRLAAAARDRVERSKAALERLAAEAERQQSAIERAMAQGERELSRQPHDHGADMARFQLERKRVAATAAALATTEEQAARIFDDLAEQHPGHAAQYRKNGEFARNLAKRAREVARKYGR